MKKYYIGQKLHLDCEIENKIIKVERIIKNILYDNNGNIKLVALSKPNGEYAGGILFKDMEYFYDNIVEVKQ